MSERRRWRRAHLSEIPSDDELPIRDGISDEEREAARAELRRDIGVHPSFAGYPRPAPAWHAIRRFFGITAFGVAAATAVDGEALIWPHTEAPYGHEELYVVVEGRARFLFDDGSEVELGASELVFVEPELGRGAVALETPTTLLVVGGTPGAYRPPIWAADWQPPADWLAARRRPA